MTACGQCGRVANQDLPAKDFAETPCGDTICDWCYPVHVANCSFCQDEEEYKV